jgi:hypothetical protein
MQVKQKFMKFSAPSQIVALLLFANLSVAQQVPQSNSQTQQSEPGGVMIDPSAGPLKPNVTPSAPPSASQPSGNEPGSGQLPNAPQAQTSPAPTSQQPASKPAQEPLGAAAAEQVRTAGGGASRPAGNAVAPIKQHQYRSFVIKLGAVAAAGIAAGTVYGLSRATSSTPPHSASAATKK